MSTASRRAKVKRNRVLRSEMLEDRRLLAGLEVVAVPYVQGVVDALMPVHEGAHITLKAIVRGADSSGDYQVWWDTDLDGDFEDDASRTVTATTGTNTIYDIGQTYIVPNVEAETDLEIRVLIRELDSGEEAYGSFRVHVKDFRPSNDPRNWTSDQLDVIEGMTLQESLWQVHRSATPSGDLTAGMWATYDFPGGLPSALKLLAANGHMPAYAPGTFDDYGLDLPANWEEQNDERWVTDPYAETALRFFNTIALSANEVEISAGNEGNLIGFAPNGEQQIGIRLPGTTDGRGIQFNSNHIGGVFDAGQVGKQGYSISALSYLLPTLAGTPIQVGEGAGHTLEWIVQQGVDWLGYAQIDGGAGMGGWYYDAREGSYTAHYDNGDAFIWATTGLADAEELGSPYGIIVDNLHKYRAANAIVTAQAADNNALHLIGIPSFVSMTAGFIEASRWLGVHNFSSVDNATAFSGYSMLSRAQLRQTYDRYVAAAASAWMQGRSSYSGWGLDSLWPQGDYLGGNTNAIYNVTEYGSNLIAARFASAFRRGSPEVANFATHDWQREFAISVTRSQTRVLNAADPQFGYDDFGQSKGPTNSIWETSNGGAAWSTVLAGLALTTPGGPKYGGITAPANALRTASIDFAGSGPFIFIQWDFNAANGLGWVFGAADATGESVSYSYPNAGNYTITMRGTRSDGRVDTFTKTIAVTDNQSPVANNDAVSGDEDSSLLIHALVDNGSGVDSDPDGNLDPTKTIVSTAPLRGILTNHQDGSFTFDPAGDFDFLAFGESTTETFSYQIEDELGEKAEGMVTVTITGLNDAPQLTISGPTVDVEEGSPAQISGTFTDPDLNDTITLTASWGNLVYDEGTSGVWSWSYDSSDDLVKMVTITAKDQSEASTYISFDLTVSNVAPQPSIDSISLMRIAQNEIVLTATATDPAGEADSLIYGYEVFFDGSIEPLVAENGLAQTAFSFTPQEAGSYEIVLTVSDEDGGSNSISETISVLSVSTTDLVLVPSSTTEVGAIENAGSSSEAGLHEWQDAVTEIWLTIGEDLPAEPFDLKWRVDNSYSYFVSPQLQDALAPTTLETSGVGVTTTIGVMSQLDLSGYSVGDRVLIATLRFAKNMNDSIGLPANEPGAYAEPTSDYGLTLVSTELVQTSQKMGIGGEAGLLVPVIYDVNDDARISLIDLTLLIRSLGDRTNTESLAFRYDFNQSGTVDLTDLTFLIRHLGISKSDNAPRINMPVLIPPPSVPNLSLEEEPAPLTTSLLEGESSFGEDSTFNEVAWYFGNVEPTQLSTNSEKSVEAVNSSAAEEILTEVLLPVPSVDARVIDSLFQSEEQNALLFDEESKYEIAFELN